MVGQLVWIFPFQRACFSGSIDSVSDVDMFAVAVFTPPVEQFFVGDLVVSDLEIELGCDVIDPAFF